METQTQATQLEDMVRIEWEDEISGKHTLVFGYDSSIDEVVVNTVTGAGVTVWGIPPGEAKKLIRLLTRA